jgi:4-amino-4-deoxy-L-arabinose transferase-like glycosyltransferase
MRRPRVTLAALTVLCLVPFLGKAIHVDEPLFVWMAQHIRLYPLDPYGFTVNWYGTVVPMVEAMRNPPLAAYVMALWGSVAGWSEVSLHALFLLPAVAAVLGIYELASSLCRRPFIAAFASVASPAFIVSSTSVMCDVMMLAWWSWALALWIQGIDAGDRRRLLGAAALTAACVLTKYNGAGLVPLLALYALWRRPGTVVYLAIPLAVLAGYAALMLRGYGGPALWRAVSLATDDHAGASPASVLAQGVVTLAFIGGCFVATLLYAVVLWPRWAAACGAAMVAAGALWPWPLAGVAAGESWHAIQLLLFVAGGVVLVALAVADVRRGLDATSALLACWLTGTVLFAGAVSWSVSARYLLTLAPVSGILLARALDARRLAGWLIWAPAAAALAIALLVARADAAFAASARTAARTFQLAHAGQPGTLWYQGHWGFQYYMDLGGAKAVDFDHPWFATGDVMIIPTNNANISVIDPKWVATSDVLEFPAGSWIRTISPRAGAGFYSSVFGSVPFVFGVATNETYTRVVIGGR